MSEPTVTFFADEDGEGGVTVPVTALPGWHTHPECGGLAHLHGMSEQPPHTHKPTQAWGPAVPTDG